MKKALVIGIDFYKEFGPLIYSVEDAESIEKVLKRNSDGSVNFDGVMLKTAENYKTPYTREQLKKDIKILFEDDSEIALFYFAGHGYVEHTGGYLITSECITGDGGLSMNELLQIANDSPAKNKIIILDCCHSGQMGTPDTGDNKAMLKEGITILTSSTNKQEAVAKEGAGVFTNLLVDALNGGAANLVGDVTPGSVYAHIDQSLGPWGQRPIFKTNVKRFVTLRKTKPSVSLEDLRKITTLFEEKDQDFPLNPSFEPDSGESNEENTKKFSILQKYNRVNLVVPNVEEHMYYAAMESESCRLTPLGQHYWKLVKQGKF